MLCPLPSALCPLPSSKFTLANKDSLSTTMRSHISSLAAAALLAVAACSPSESESDPRLTKLTVGMSRDVALRVLGDSTSGDSLANIYRREQYLFGGEPLEILFYSPQGLREGQGAAAAESTLRPVVLNMGRVTGWGWAHFDSVARTHEIRVRVR